MQRYLQAPQDEAGSPWLTAAAGAAVLGTIAYRRPRAAAMFAGGVALVTAPYLGFMVATVNRFGKVATGGGGSELSSGTSVWQHAARVCCCMSMMSSLPTHALPSLVALPCRIPAVCGQAGQHSRDDGCGRRRRLWRRPQHGGLVCRGERRGRRRQRVEVTALGCTSP